MANSTPSTTNRRLTGIPVLLTVAALPVLNFFLFGTFNLFAGNPEEFNGGFRDILPHFVPAMIVAWLVLSAIGLACRGRLRQRYVCLLFGLGLLIWAQGTFFTGDYGVLDGRGLDWQALDWPRWLDILLWIGIIAGVIVGYQHLTTVVLPATVALIVLQLVAATHLDISSETRLWSAPVSIDHGPPEGIFRYSSEHNVVHLVLDNFQTDIFEELVAEAGLEETFDGFILFRENAAVTPYTTLAIPSILSGRVYDGTEPSSTFFRRGVEDGLPSYLHKEGYTVNLSTMRSLDESDHDHMYRVPSIYNATVDEIIRNNSDQLLDITLFRHVPHLARNWIYNENNWRIQSLFADSEEQVKSFAHKTFFRDYTQRIEAESEGRAYHFLHLWPPHPPYVTTENGDYAGEALLNTRENYKNEARGIVVHVIDFLAELKNLGIYDDTLIVLHSDHGGAFEPEFTPTRTLALNAVKPRGSRGPLRVSNAQVSVSDVAATILEQEGLEIDWPGRSVFEVDENEQRQRRLVFYHGERDEYLKPVLIEGSLYSPDSYTYEDSIELDKEPEKYTYGEVANVGIGDVGALYLSTGWSTPSPGLVWNHGHEATLQIPVDPPEADLQLTLWLIPSIHGDALPRQRIRVYMKEQLIGDWELHERESVSLKATIPAGLVDSDELIIRFDLPDAARQADLGVGGDKRLQAIALRRFRIDAK